MSRRLPLCCIVPPHILQKLVESKSERLRKIALETLLSSTHIRARRSVLSLLPTMGTPAGTKRRTIYDAHHRETVTGLLVRDEGGPPTGDSVADEAYDHLGVTYDFYRQVLDRNSLDGNGMRLDAIVHYGDQINNAFWDGQRMLFGDGDEEVFTNFSKSLDVVAHELAHGVTEFTAGLIYENQPGALNESMSDVFGSLVKQWHLGQDAATADWLIGGDIFTPDLPGDGLRSLKNPGQAYNNPILGKDPQPAHMRDYVHLPNTRAGDWGGVHINSGIPNHAFYLVATRLGGNAWEAAGKIWYEALLNSLGPTAQFQDFADNTYSIACRHYGPSEQQAVLSGWREVGIRVSGTPGAVASTARAGRNGDEDDLRSQLKALARKVDLMMKRAKGEAHA